MRQCQRLTIWSGCLAHAKEKTGRGDPRLTIFVREPTVAPQKLGPRVDLRPAARPRRQAPTPRTHDGTQAPAAHPRRTCALCTQKRPEHMSRHAPSTPPETSLFVSAAARARRWQQDRGQCTWHGIGRLSRRRHGDRMSGCGAPCGALFLVLSA
jgi:hypothetical protein